jgi:hypothetical protein
MALRSGHIGDVVACSAGRFALRRIVTQLSLVLRRSKKRRPPWAFC